MFNYFRDIIMNNEKFQKITHATNNITSNVLPEMSEITADHGWRMEITHRCRR
jgi:hypothetical protein